MPRFLLLAAMLTFGTAHAQTSSVPAPLEVMRLAPQLVAFAGGDANFANLVNGLALGTPVTLTTPLTTGGTQVLTFTPTGTMSALQIAQMLEGARQSLIARGIATPSAQQLGAVLTGGSLTTALGSVPVNPLVTTNTPATTIVQQPQQVQGPPATVVQSIISGGGIPGTATAATGGTAPRNLSDSTFPRGISDTPFPRGISDTPPPAVSGATTVPPTTPSITITPGAR